MAEYAVRRQLVSKQISSTKESSLCNEKMAEYAVRRQLVQQKKVTKGASMGVKGGAWALKEEPGR
jgi:hypothetical protein